MEESIIGSILAFLIVVFSYKGFRDKGFFEHYLFDVDKVLIDKQYYRLISSAFLHGSWFHLGFNVIALLSFSGEVEWFFGWWQYIILFFGSVLGADILSLFFHRNHGDYRAVGASGGVSGLVMAFIVASPDSLISFILIPIGIKGWILGIAYIFITIIAIKRSNDNIGHEAHLGGAITGILLAILFKPALIMAHPWLIAAILIPCIVFLWLSITNPAFFLVKDNWNLNFGKPKSPLRISHKKKKISKEEELNLLLSKIKKKGLEGLTKKERDRLEELSKD
jgi:membrane associated rhomboid family serine protease